MASFFIIGKILHSNFKQSQAKSFYVYQFQVLSIDGFYSIVNVYSKDKISLKDDEEIKLPIFITVIDGRIIYETKGVKNG
jgi:hypothetical protein